MAGRRNPLYVLAESLDWASDTDKMLGQFMRAAGERLLGEAKRRSPVAKGKLRNSISLETSKEGAKWVATVGTNVYYAPYMEYGTGLVHDHPDWPRRRHSPFTVDSDGKVIPVPALTAYAQWRGMGPGAGWALAAAIRKRGGLLPRRYLRGAAEKLRPQIVESLRIAIRRLGQGGMA